MLWLSIQIAFLSDQAVTNEGVFIDNFVIQSTASVRDQSLDFISIYPNPSQGIFTINNKSNSDLSLIIYDITGKQVFFKNNVSDLSFEIDLSSLTNEIYTIKINTDSNVITKKIVKL